MIAEVSGVDVKMSLHRLPFLLHAIVEIPACLNFFLFPDDQLSIPTPHAHAIIRQYAVLLFSSVCISIILAFKDKDSTSGKIAGALAIYHIAPCVRAWSRSQARVPSESYVLMKDPSLHFYVHLVCFVSLATAFVRSLRLR